MAAVGPHVSVLAGQQDSVENAVRLSTVQAVGAAAQPGEIRQQAYQCLGAPRAGLDRRSNGACTSGCCWSR